MLVFARAAPDLHSLNPGQSPAVVITQTHNLCGGERKRDGEEEERWERGGSHGEHRPANTCQLFQAKIVYVLEKERTLGNLGKTAPVSVMRTWALAFTHAHCSCS